MSVPSKSVLLDIIHFFLGLLIQIFFFAFSFRKRKHRPRPKDVVILHHPGRGPWAPSMIPFAVKVETYLKMTGIPYKSYPGLQRSPKNKFPWIEYNGTAIGDSSLIIDFLNEKMGVDLNKHLTSKERAVAKAFRHAIEEHAYWIGVYYRWGYFFDLSLMTETMGIPSKIVTWVISRTMQKYAYAQGMGRHSFEEVTKIMYEDFQMVSDFLGDKTFLMGDEPCEDDCAVFGMLSQIRWDMPGTGIKDFAERYPNLCDYCDRIKDKFWPDWDECITFGGTKKPLK